jgi:glutathione S-transferase
MPPLFKALSAIINSMSQPGTKEGFARLITIPYSHYNERVRWVLDHSPLRDRYTEDGHPPGFHQFAVHGVTRGKLSSTPTLVIPKSLLPAKSPAPENDPDEQSGFLSRLGTRQEVINQSDKIVSRLCALFPRELGWMYPAPKQAEIRAYEAELSAGLAAATRQIAYTHLVVTRTEWTKHATIISRGSSPAEQFLYSFRKVHGQAARYLKARMGCRTARLPAAVKIVERTFEDAGQRLARAGAKCEGQKAWLFGAQPTAADITFAALAYPVLFPPELSAVSFAFESLPEELQKLALRMRKTPAGKHALRVYREKRWPADERDLTRALAEKSAKEGGPKVRLVRSRGDGRRWRIPIIPIALGVHAALSAATDINGVQG